MNVSNFCQPFTFAPATVVAIEVMDGHNDWTDWARKSLKTSSDSEDSNVSFEVCYACFWRHCDMIVWENPFFTLPQNSVVFIQKTLQLKINTLEIKFPCKNCQLWPPFANVIKNSKFLEGVLSENRNVIISFSCTRNIWNCRTGFSSVLQHPTKFQAKIFTRKYFSWGKTKNPLRGWANVLVFLRP